MPHLEPLLQTVSDQGDDGGLPRFVEQEFRDFPRCGVLAEGFTRLRCAECAFERLVPFSRTGRGVCPSREGRRMAERTASLVDAVQPHVPVRQWVLTLPYRLRYRLAWDHELCRAVLGVYARGLLAFSARTARARGICDGQSGTVTAIQRFTSGVTLTVYFHTLVLDGVFSGGPPDGLTFHPAPPPSDEEVAHVLAPIRRRVRRVRVRRNLEPGDADTEPADPLAEASPMLAGLGGALVKDRVALGPRAGARMRRLGQQRLAATRRRPHTGLPGLSPDGRALVEALVGPDLNEPIGFAELHVAGKHQG